MSRRATARGRPAALALAVGVALALAPVAARAGEVVRIAVALGVSRVRVEGEGLAATRLAAGAQQEAVSGGAAEVALVDGALSVNGAPLEDAGLVFTARGPLRASATPVALEEGELEVRREGAGLTVIHALPIEDYVAAVVGSEMPPSFPPAALEAQAVAARTFAVFKKLAALEEGHGWHLGATVLHQVYRGTAVDPRARAAAEATAGLVLTYEHAPIEAYFHAACGGTTETGAAALGRDLPYLRSVPCDHCHGAPGFAWHARVDASELGRLAGLSGPVRRARIAARTSTGRAARVELAAARGRVTLGAVDLRQRLGFKRLPSLLFSVRMDGDAVVFDGRGLGHGAGLCQWGAAGWARAGEGYQAILARYYPGTELVRMY